VARATTRGVGSRSLAFTRLGLDLDGRRLRGQRHRRAREAEDVGHHLGQDGLLRPASPGAGADPDPHALAGDALARASTARKTRGRRVAPTGPL